MIIDKQSFDHKPTHKGLDPIKPRILFYYLLNIHAYPQARLTAKQKLQADLNKSVSEAPNIALPSSSAAINTDTLPELSFNTDKLNSLQKSAMALQNLPAALTELCWLQASSQAINAHTSVAANLLQIYSNSIECDPSTSNPSLPAVNSFAFTQYPQFQDWAFELPVIGLCLAQFPHEYRAEILGFTLAYTLNLSKQTENKKNTFRTHALKAVKHSMYSGNQQQRQQQWLRICSGFHLYQSNKQNFLDQIQYQHPRSPQQHMIALLMDKALYAQGHHKQHKLADRKLDDWFATQPFPAEDFLHALAQSSYIDLKKPENSPLLNQLTVLGGPMFRIFSKVELQIVHDWVSSLSKKNDTPEPISEAHPPKLIRHSNLSGKIKYKQSIRGKTPPRQLFHHLLHIDTYPEYLPVAMRTAQAVLNKVRRWHWLTPTTGYGTFFEYSHEALHHRTEQVFRQQMTAYQPPKVKPKLDKAVYIWGIEQLAPALLVDGCWLQNISQVDSRQTQVSKRLFQIYADEIGNGQPRLNHPNVYRQLLHSLNIQLPDFETQAFSQHARFLDSAFDVPVYLLAISQFPKQLLPEIIGLTLAIELSGLGAPYMSLIDELDYWSIDSTIVRLHLSIDNLASGHAAIARDVVGLYLDQILMTAGHDTMQAHWQRIWTGLLSLDAATQRFRHRMIFCYALRQIKNKFYGSNNNLPF